VLNKKLILLFVVWSHAVHAQFGGYQSYDFLHAPSYARLAALGGVNVSLVDQDVNLFMSNPSLVSDSLVGQASLSYQFMISDIGQTTLAYTHSFKKIGQLHMGVQHVGYGEMESFDELGASLGTFKAGETVLVIGKSFKQNHFRYGANIKAAFSSIAGYRSNAFLVDLGGAFVHPEKDLNIGMVIKNLGVVGKRYTTSKVTLPLDIQVGVSMKPENMPVRFSFTAYNLTRNKITYFVPGFGDEPSGLNRLFRRINFGAEILVHKNVSLLTGYNYLLHQELKTTSGGGMAGFTVGLSAKVKSIELVVSRSAYAIGQAAYTFTLASNINKLLK
jgi:hypothetical protein